MSTERLNEIIQQTAILTADEKLALADYLMKQVTPAETSNQPGDGIGVVEYEVEVQRKKRNVEWLKAHQADYVDRYVALDGGQLVADGATFREVAEATRKMGIKRLLITHVPDPNTAYFGGW